MNSNSSVLLSITIPTWNRSQLLHELICELEEEIIKYELSKHIEIFIINNGSDDNTEIICLSEIAKHPFIKYKNNNKNIGARNNVLNCFKFNQGKFILLLGDDDRLTKGALKNIIQFLLEHPNTDLLLDTSLKTFSTNKIENIGIDYLVKNYLYLIGNAGVFIYNSTLAKSILSSHNFDFFNSTWPQTQIMLLGLNFSSSKLIYLTEINIHSNSKHDQVMMYNSYYLLRGLYFDLADAIDSIKSEIPESNYKSARKYFKDHILQITFNILQCGVYVDNSEQRKKTIEYIKLHKFKYSFHEKLFLNLIVLVLSLPTWISKMLSDIFIFITRGNKGIEKKNSFVNLEIQKIQNKKNNNKSIRTFDFTS